jgi:uncharacterized protein
MLEILGLILLGVFAGSLAATLGIGGGIIFVPVLVAVFGFSQLDAQGTSLAIIVPTAIVGTITHARAGRVDWKVVAVVGAGGIFGALGGASLAQNLDEAVLRRIFAIVLIILAIRMAGRAWTVRKASAAVDTG